MPPFHLLDQYESLVQQHRAQFAPILTELQASVTSTLQQLQQQEQPLVAAQTEQLAQLQTQLATDARCLLNSVELAAFTAEVRSIPAFKRWNQTEPSPEVDPNSANWQLAQIDLLLAIRDYQATVDHAAYDDERTHSTYGYQAIVQIGDRSRPIEVLTERVYSPIERNSYSLRQQLTYYIEGDVSHLLSQQNITHDQNILAQEITYLFGCAVRLLSLTPQTVQFHYSSTEAIA